MSDPLILYKAGCLDAAAAKELLLERFPGAVSVAIGPCDEARWNKNTWILGFTPGSPCTARVVLATPDASMAMQVWRKLHTWACPCPKQPGTGATTITKDPPTWLRYLDDAVREAWGELEDSEAVWAFFEDRIAEGEVESLAVYLVRCTELPTIWVTVGSAILRARERWENEIRGKTRHCHHFGPISRLCYHLDRFVEDEEMPTGRVHMERDQLRTKLREALDHLYNPHAVAEMSREGWLEWWRPACELAGVADREDGR